jgi:hypothetical protein
MSTCSSSPLWAQEHAVHAQRSNAVRTPGPPAPNAHLAPKSRRAKIRLQTMDVCISSGSIGAGSRAAQTMSSSCATASQAPMSTKGPLGRASMAGLTWPALRRGGRGGRGQRLLGCLAAWAWDAAAAAVGAGPVGLPARRSAAIQQQQCSSGSGGGGRRRAATPHPPVAERQEQEVYDDVACRVGQGRAPHGAVKRGSHTRHRTCTSRRWLDRHGRRCAAGSFKQGGGDSSALPARGWSRAVAGPPKTWSCARKNRWPPIGTSASL